MSVLIKGLKMQKDKDVILRIDSKGEVYIYGNYPTEIHEAVELPNHGDLIDRDALFDDNSWDWFNEWGSTVNKQAELVVNAPVIIPAERSESDE